jgi:hypothetical protein
VGRVEAANKKNWQSVANTELWILI